jgi:diacylglycerol kinase family enzyme
LKVEAIINTSSGGCNSEFEQKILSILRRAGIYEPKVWCGEAKEMERSFAEAAGQELEVLIVLGGDGTIRTNAEACAEKGLYLIALPGGTMNVLPRALYGDVAWEESLKNTLAAPSVKVLSEVGSRASSFLSPPLWERLRFWQNPANLCAREI